MTSVASSAPRGREGGTIGRRGGSAAGSAPGVSDGVLGAATSLGQRQGPTIYQKRIEAGKG